MARTKGIRPNPSRNDRTVKVDAVVVGMAEMCARKRGISLAEYLSEILRAPVGRDFNHDMEEFKKMNST